MEAIHKHLATESELNAVLAQIETLRGRAAVLLKEHEQSTMAALQDKQRARWPEEAPTSVLLLIVEQCIHPGLPHCLMTSTALRDLIRPQLHKTIPHLRVPRDMPSIQAAIELAPSGGLIAVHEGLYNDERLIVNRCVHIRGVGRVEQIVIGPTRCTAGSTQASLTGVTLTCGQRNQPAITLQDTDMLLERCTMSGKAYGVRIKGAECAPTLSHCNISSNTQWWVIIEDSNKPKVDRCKIRDTDGGVFVLKQGTSTFTTCNISNNTKCGVAVQGNGSNPHLERCQIRDNEGGGVVVQKQGAGTFTECDIEITRTAVCKCRARAATQSSSAARSEATRIAV